MFRSQVVSLVIFLRISDNCWSAPSPLLCSPRVSCADTDSVPDNWIIGMGSHNRHRTFLGTRVTRGRNNDTEAKPHRPGQTKYRRLLTAGAKNASASGLRVSLFVAVQ